MMEKTFVMGRDGSLSRISLSKTPTQKVAFAPVRVWEKDGKAGVALEATELVIQEGEIRTKMADCFTVDKL